MDTSDYLLILFFLVMFSIYDVDELPRFNLLVIFYSTYYF